MLFGQNGIITRAKEAKFLNNLSRMKEEIELYRLGKEAEEEINVYPITEETMESADKTSFSEELKYKLLSLANTTASGGIPAIEQIDYSKFYKIDKEKVSSAKEYEEDLYLFYQGDSYKVITTKGVKYQGKTIYVLIPLDDIADPQYITAGDNTYKLYGDGTLKVVGQKTVNNGASQEVDKTKGLQELNLEKINEQSGNKMLLPAKKIYISTGTAYVIDQNDDLWAWGANDYNKLGQGHSFLITEPTKILEERTGEIKNVKAKKVWAGSTNTWIIDTEGRLWGCGTNTTGELGQGNFEAYSNFVQVKGIDTNTIENIELSRTPLSGVTIIKCNDGNIYAAGRNTFGNLGIKNTTSQSRFIKLSDYDEKWKTIKKVCTNGLYIIALSEDGIVYVSGYNSNGQLGTGDTINKKELTQIADNMQDINVYVMLDKEGNIYRKGTSVYVVEGLKDPNIKLLRDTVIESDGKVYAVEKDGIVPFYKNYPNIKLLNAHDVIAFESNGKMYINGYPNITWPKALSEYSLREIANDIVFMQGIEGNINFVNRKGEVYEKIGEKNTELTNISKIISSSTSRYALTKDNTLYAKGTSNTGLWGSLTEKKQYTQVTKDGTNIFDNIKEVYTTRARGAYGVSVVFQMLDHKIYWAGSDGVTILPNTVGDVTSPGMGKISNYPKEVTSPGLEAIKDNIKDLKYCYMHSGGIQGGNSLILTNDGKLYTYATNANLSGKGNIISDFEELVIREGQTVEKIDTIDGLSFAVLSNGEVYAWGYNTYGIMGEGYEIGGVYPTPVKLNTPAHIKSISIGEGFAILVDRSGYVYGIGKNDYGQLGTGNTEGVSNFVRCPELEK